MIADVPLNIAIGLVGALAFTIFQMTTLNVVPKLWSLRFWAVNGLNLFYAGLSWLNLRAVDHSTVSVQMFLGFGSAFVSWLSFALVVQNHENKLTKRQLAGFLASIALTIIGEINKRVNL